MSREEILEIVLKAKADTIKAVDEQLISEELIPKTIREQYINAVMSMTPQDHPFEGMGNKYNFLFNAARRMFASCISNAKPENEPVIDFTNMAVEIRKELFCVGGSECLPIPMAA
ncbi:MAG: hypothetical protein JWM20_401 [Patescibacteria group bacterium]|nr:hypothetical protein [Patescibacteria group bacterium]